LNEPMRAGKTQYFNARNVPDKYKDELDAILDNARFIHGDNFVKHVKFLMNMDSMLSMITQNTTLDEGCTPQQMSEVISNVVTQLVGSHAEALGLKFEQEEPAEKTMEALKSIVDSFERDLNADLRKKKGSK